MAKQYPNRSDLRNKGGKVAKMAATGQTYGEAGKQMAAQAAVPVAASPTSAPPASRPSVAPGSLGAFDRATEAPLEPVTSGVDFGPGRNMQQAGIRPVPNLGNSVLQELITLYNLFPNDDLANAISVLTDRQ